MTGASEDADAAGKPKLSFMRPKLDNILEQQAVDEGTEASPRLRMDEKHHFMEPDAIPEECEEDDDFGLGAEAGAGSSSSRSSGRGGASSNAAAGGGAPAAAGSAAGSGAKARGSPPGFLKSSGTGGGSSNPSGGSQATHSISPVSSKSSKFGALPWTDYFDESFSIPLPNGDMFHAYRAGKGGPVLLCLHGGGYSGLSFAVAASKIKGRMGSGIAIGSPSDVTILAVDLRGHGLTTTSDDSDLSAQTLCSDVVRVVRHLYPSQPPAIVLIGHSMGGAIAVRVAASLQLPSLSGLVVVDVVEGTAMASLVHMHSILAARPPSFPSIEKAIEWSLRNGSLRNPDSARVSVPSTLVLDREHKRYVWRAALEGSEKFWKGWYTGLSEEFLRSPVPKVLLLAGTDRLDKALTIAQMQGKFQMLVVRHSGHAIQEDEPDEFAAAVLHFVTRNRISEHGVVIGRWGGSTHA